MSQFTSMFVTLVANLDSARRREDGQTLAEYALILALIAVLVVVAIAFLQGSISNLFSEIGSQL